MCEYQIELRRIRLEIEKALENTKKLRDEPDRLSRLIFGDSLDRLYTAQILAFQRALQIIDKPR